MVHTYSKLVFAVAVLSIFLLSGHAQKVIHVPSDAATIQAGINAANTGDTVLIAPGIYNEHVDFRGKAITVIGDGPSVILDGGGGSGPVVLFTSGETRNSILDNVTVQNGAAVGSPTAGGIFISNASPTIRNSIIRNNKGCGIAAFNSGVLIQANSINGNNETDYFFCRQADTFNVEQLGGGVLIFGPTSSNQEPEIIGNTIFENAAARGGGGITAIDAGRLLIQNNILTGNESDDIGAAIVVQRNMSPRIIQNLVYGNVTNPIYYNPAEGSVGPGLNMDLAKGTFSSVPAYVVNNTFVDNVVLFVSGPNHDANHSGTQVYLDGFYNRIRLSNNLVVGSGPFSAFECESSERPPSPLPEFDHNDVFNEDGSQAYSGACVGETGSNGNISADPNFALRSGPNPYQLQLPSPAIDTGNNDAPDRPETDFLGQPRVQDGLGISQSVIDVGAYEYPGTPCTTLCPPPPPPPIPAFAIDVTPATLTLQTQHHGTVTVTVTPISGIVGQVALACVGLPVYASCSFKTQTLNFSGTDPQSTTLTIDTSVIHNFASDTHLTIRSVAPFAFAAMLFPLCLIITPAKRRRLQLCALISTLLLGVSSCSGKYPDSTPPGSYTFTITGVSPAAQSGQSATLNFLVTP